MDFTLRKLAIAIMVALVGLVPIVRLAHSETAKLDPPSSNTAIRFSSLSLEQGLSQSVVTVIYQDSLGYLWFGTHDGLNRYDGYNFVIYRPDPDDSTSISDRMISSIIEDSQGGLWIGTVLGGLNRYDRGTDQFTHLTHNPVDPGGLSGNSVRVLEFDPQGRLWIGTDGGLDIFDPQQGIFITHYVYDSQVSTGLAHYGVNDILQDHTGMMWVASEGGLSYYDPSNDTFNHITHNPGDPGSLVSNRVTCIYEDRDGFLWLGTPVGIDRMNRQDQKIEHFTADALTPESLSNSVVNDILEDHFGNLWVGTADGLNLMDSAKGSFTVYRSRFDDPTSISNSTILSLVEDREGLLWIGTAGGGVNKLDYGRNKFPLLQYDPNAPKNISSFGLLEDHNGKLWFTIPGEGVLSLDRSTGKYIFYRHDPAAPDDSLLDDFVQSISESHDGTIWIGGQNGLNALDPNIGLITQYTYDEVNLDNPHSLGGQVVGFIMEDSQGILWIAMPTGLDSFNPETGIFTHYRSDHTDPASLSNPNVAYVYESAEGEIWLGMYEGGLSKLDRESGKFTHYRHNPIDPDSISSDAVYMIMQDQTGTMWLGTNEGLNRFDPETGKAIYYTVKDGLPNDVVYAIVEDGQGYFWLSTNFGLSRFDPRTGNTQNYDYDDGLQSNEFNPFAFAKTRSGEIIFSGIDGTNIFRPEMIQNNEYVPPVVLTHLTQGGEPLTLQPAASSEQTLILQWPYNYFEFEFSALSYSNPAENQYAYQLENFDPDWIDSGSNHFGRYTNLPHGTYTLSIKGSNNDGVWNESGTELSVTVVPPFWQTWWFRFSTVLLVGGAVFAIYRLRVHNIESYNRHLKSQVDERTREIETLFEQTKELAIIEERNRLARDLHDSAKQKAFAALAQLGAVRSMIPRDQASAITHLNEVEDLVYEVIQELTFLIQEMYPLALKEKGLITVLREYIYEWENRNDIRVNLVVDHERQLPLEIEQAFYRITQESLANIARHSHASQVNIELNYNGEAVEMLLTDNGIGFNPAQKPAGVGLRTMQERALMIGGCLEIHSKPGEGARIRVIVPVRQIDNSSPDDINGGLHGSSNHNPDR